MRFYALFSLFIYEKIFKRDIKFNNIFFNYKIFNDIVQFVNSLKMVRSQNIIK